MNWKHVLETLKPLYVYINDPSKIEDEFLEQIERRVQQYRGRFRPNQRFGKTSHETCHASGVVITRQSAG